MFLGLPEILLNVRINIQNQQKPIIKYLLHRHMVFKC